jgi:hypothetical protein
VKVSSKVYSKLSVFLGICIAIKHYMQAAQVHSQKARGTRCHHSAVQDGENPSSRITEYAAIILTPSCICALEHSKWCVSSGCNQLERSPAARVQHMLGFLGYFETSICELLAVLAVRGAFCCKRTCVVFVLQALLTDQHVTFPCTFCCSTAGA